MLEIRLAETAGPVERAPLATTLYSDRFLLRRPLLDALTADPAGPPVLLIDELDRTDEPFLLEILSDSRSRSPSWAPCAHRRRRS